MCGLSGRQGPGGASFEFGEDLFATRLQIGLARRVREPNTKRIDLGPIGGSPAIGVGELRIDRLSLAPWVWGACECSNKFLGGGEGFTATE
jgi:hypothetical protein